jgi:glycerol-3-phosphate dehydrogenase (NAD(P)+)
MLAVVGAGAMGTALAAQLHRAGHPVALLATDHDGPFVDAFRAGSLHPGIGQPFPPCELFEHQDWKRGLADAEIVVLAVSTAGVEHTVREVAEHAPPDAVWAVATKGWEETTLRSAGRVVADVLGDPKRVVVVVGPSLASEIANGVPTAVVCASEDHIAVRRVAGTFASPLFRTYVSDDVVGVEVGAALKNVIAIAVGMADGLAPEYGVDAMTNTTAFLFSRGLVEIARLARAMRGRLETVLGLAGAGDLYVTCLGGRNARFGRLVGGGMTPEQAIAEMRTTVEGYQNARSAAALAAKFRLDLPIVRSVASVVAGESTPREAIEGILAGTVEEEFNP